MLETCIAYKERRCHSCDLMELGYKKSIEVKEEAFFQLFPKQNILHYQNPEVLGKAFQSRFKLKLSVKEMHNGLSFGVYNQAQEFSVLEDCPLHHRDLNQALLHARSILEQAKVTAYNLSNRTGEIKAVVINKSNERDELMIRMVLRSKESLDRIRKVCNEINQLSDQMKYIYSCIIQPKHIASFEGGEEILLTDKQTMTFQFDQFQLVLGVKSFFQVTPRIANELYREVGHYLQKNSVDSLLDLYCGVGAFSFFASPFVKKIKGVEISNDSINYANQAKLLNNVQNIEFEACDVDKVWEHSNEKYQAILVNPPRRGVGDFSMGEIINLTPDILIYSSCNFETLYKDYQKIKEFYEVDFVKIFDMFPFTSHFEVLMIFTKR